MTRATNSETISQHIKVIYKILSSVQPQLAEWCPSVRLSLDKETCSLLTNPDLHEPAEQSLPRAGWCQEHRVSNSVAGDVCQQWLTVAATSHVVVRQSRQLGLVQTDAVDRRGLDVSEYVSKT